MNKDTFVKVGVGVGLEILGLGISHEQVKAQDQTNTNPTAVPSIEITPAIEINSPNSTETTHAIPVPTFEVPIGLAQLVDNQLQETDELEIPIDSFISWINQANPDPETVSRFENIISTFELLANDRLQDPTNPEAQVDAVDTFIELNRGEDGTVLGSLYARVLVDGLVSRDDGITPIPPDSIFTPFVTANGERQELGIMNDNDGLGTQVTLNIDLVQNGDQLTGVVIKELKGTPISILTESLDGTSQETGALEGSVSAPDGVNFRNLTGEPIGNLPFGTEMVILLEARPIPGQENLGNFYEVLVGNQVGLVSAEYLTTQQNFDTSTFNVNSSVGTSTEAESPSFPIIRVDESGNYYISVNGEESQVDRIRYVYHGGYDIELEPEFGVFREQITPEGYGNPIFHIDGVYTHNDRITRSLEVPSLDKTIDVELVRFYISLPIDEGKTITIRGNTLNFEQFGYEAPYGLMYVGGAENITWENLQELLVPNKEVVAQVASLGNSPEDVINAFGGDCTPMCEQIIALGSATADSKELLNQLANGNSSQIKNGQIIDVAMVATFMFGRPANP